MSKGSKPDFLVKAKQSPESEFFVICGAAWKWKNGEGYVIKLHSVPVANWDGSLLLTPPKEGE